MSLFISFVGALFAFALNASPAIALSLNPDAASPGIKDANSLHSIIFALVIVVIVVVNVALLRAARSRSRHTSPSTSQKPVPTSVALGSGIFSVIIFLGAVATRSTAVIIGALAVIVILNLVLLKGAGPRARTGSGKVSQTSIAAALIGLTLVLFVIATIFSDRSREIPAVNSEPVAGQVEGKPLAITASGQQWLWRFDYPNGAFSYRRLVVPAGVTVALKLVSTDVIHGWNVPELTGKAQAVPGKTNYVYFNAEDPGTYRSSSSVFSGQGYDTMEIEVKVVPTDEYESEIEALKTDIQDAQDKVEEEFAASEQKAETSVEAQEKSETIPANDQTESADAE